MLKNALIIVVLMLQLIASQSIALVVLPPDTCRVLLPALSGSYTGDCVDGLAEGKGMAKGTDTYKGAFVQGLPHGKGEYVFANGDGYKGSFSRGVMHGKGKFTRGVNGRKEVMKGYWKEGVYAGAVDPDLTHRVTGQGGITGYTMKRVADSGCRVTINMEAAFSRFWPDDLKVEASSSQPLVGHKTVTVVGYFLPLHVEVRFSIPTGFMRKECYFISDILKEGEWEVKLKLD